MTRSLPLIAPSEPGCVGCRALCCHKLVLPMPAPASPAHIADMRWRLHFDTVNVYASGGRWFMVIDGTCQYLDTATSMCRIYKDRPRHCRDYNPPFCERYIDPAETRLRTPEELDEFLAERSERASTGAPEPE